MENDNSTINMVEIEEIGEEIVEDNDSIYEDSIDFIYKSNTNNTNNTNNTTNTSNTSNTSNKPNKPNKNKIYEISEISEKFDDCEEFEKFNEFEELNNVENSKNRNKSIEKRLNIIEKKVDRILFILENDIKSNLDGYLNFCRGLYSKVRTPCEYMLQKINYIRGIDEEVKLIDF